MEDEDGVWICTLCHDPLEASPVTYEDDEQNQYCHKCTHADCAECGKPVYVEEMTENMHRSCAARDRWASDCWDRAKDMEDGRVWSYEG